MYTAYLTVGRDRSFQEDKVPGCEGPINSIRLDHKIRGIQSSDWSMQLDPAV